MNDNADTPVPATLDEGRANFRKAISAITLSINTNGLQLAELWVVLETGIETYKALLAHSELPDGDREKITGALEVLEPVFVELSTALSVVELAAQSIAEGSFTPELREQVNAGPALPEGFKLH